jgi:hypothetical protein
MHPRGSVSLRVGRSRVRNSTDLRLRRVDTAQAVHKALLVVPGDVVSGDEFDIGQGAQRAATKQSARMHSFLNSLIVVSASGLSYASPTLRIEGRRLESVSVSANLTLVN